MTMGIYNRFIFTLLILLVKNILWQIYAQHKFKLEQNYPNPFNPTTTISYQIPDFSFVSIKVYDVLSNEVTTLVNEEKLAGSYEVEFDAIDLPSGIYIYRLEAANYVESRKMVLIK